MAAITPGTFVSLQAHEAQKLTLPPPDLALQVTVHRSAIPKSGEATPLTTVLHRGAAGVIDWIGSLDESMLAAGQTPGETPRAELNQYLFNSQDCWHAVRPGRLVDPKHGDPYLTVYGGDRPWIVIGTIPNTSLLAVPLNDAWGNPKWYAPQIEAKDLLFQNSKKFQMELAHIWSLPTAVQRIGQVASAAIPELQKQCLKYFP